MTIPTPLLSSSSSTEDLLERAATTSSSLLSPPHSSQSGSFGTGLSSSLHPPTPSSYSSSSSTVTFELLSQSDAVDVPNVALHSVGGASGGGGDTIKINILDTRGKKFTLNATPTTTVHSLKMSSHVLHSVPPPQQRLIYMGRSLNRGNVTLGELGMENGMEVTVHLFPRPIVETTYEGNGDEIESGIGRESNSNSSNSGNSRSSSHPTPANPSTSRAHVPRILIADEAAAIEMRRTVNGGFVPPQGGSRRNAANGRSNGNNGGGGDGAILTDLEMTNLTNGWTGSVENRRRVKMLAALLVLVSMMQLLTLFTILAGIQSEPNPASSGYGNNANADCTDPINCYSTSSTNQDGSSTYVPRTWRKTDYIDLGVSIMGIWVGMQGLRATQDETTESAKKYFYGLLLTGVSWVSFR